MGMKFMPIHESNKKIKGNDNMKKSIVACGLIGLLLIGCESKEAEVIEQQVETVIEKPSDKVELPSEKNFELLMVTKFGDILVSGNNEDISVTYEIDQDTKTIYVYEDVKGIKDLTTGVISYPSDLLSSWQELVDSCINTSVSFQEMLDEYVDGWTLVMAFGDEETDTWYVLTVEGTLVTDVVSEFVEKQKGTQI
jgi:hypothetical protein